MAAPEAPPKEKKTIAHMLSSNRADWRSFSAMFAVPEGPVGPPRRFVPFPELLYTIHRIIVSGSEIKPEIARN